MEFQRAMKPSTWSQIVTLKWYMPMHVLADLFSAQCNKDMHRTPTLFVFKPILEALFSSIMDPGWDLKIVLGNDLIKCRVLQDSMTFRYHTERSMLYSSFAYVRERFFQDESSWITKMTILLCCRL